MKCADYTSAPLSKVFSIELSAQELSLVPPSGHTSVHLGVHLRLHGK
jgi:hypothetical protein